MKRKQQSTATQQTKKSTKKQDQYTTLSKAKSKNNQQKNGLSGNVALKSVHRQNNQFQQKQQQNYVLDDSEYFEYKGVAEFDKIICKGTDNERMKYITQLRNYGIRNVEKSELVPVCIDFPKINMIKGQARIIEETKIVYKEVIQVNHTFRCTWACESHNVVNKDSDQFSKFIERTEVTGTFFQNLYESLNDFEGWHKDDIQKSSNNIEQVEESKTVTPIFQITQVEQAADQTITNAKSNKQKQKENKSFQRKRDLKALAKKATKKSNKNKNDPLTLDSKVDLSDSDSNDLDDDLSENESDTNPTDTKESNGKTTQQDMNKRITSMSSRANIIFKKHHPAMKQNQLNYNQPSRMLHAPNMQARMGMGGGGQLIQQSQQSQQLKYGSINPAILLSQYTTTTKGLNLFKMSTHEAQLRNMMMLSQGQGGTLGYNQSLQINRNVQSQQMQKIMQMGYQSHKSQTLPVITPPSYQQKSQLPIIQTQSQSIQQNQQQSASPLNIQNGSESSDSDIEMIDSSQFQESIIQNKPAVPISYNDQQAKVNIRPEQILRPIQQQAPQNVFSKVKTVTLINSQQAPPQNNIHLYRNNSKSQQIQQNHYYGQNSNLSLKKQSQYQQQQYIQPNHNSQQQKLSYGGNYSQQLQQLNKRINSYGHKSQQTQQYDNTRTQQQFQNSRQIINIVRQQSNSSINRNYNDNRDNSSSSRSVQDSYRNIATIPKKQRLV